MKRLICIILSAVMIMTALPVLSMVDERIEGDITVLDNTSGSSGKRLILDAPVESGDIFLLEYLYTAEDSSASAFACVRNEYNANGWYPVYFKNGEILVNYVTPEINNTGYIKAGTVRKGETYFIQAILTAGGNDGYTTKGTVYINGKKAADKVTVSINPVKTPIDSLYVSKGVKATLTKITEFDYSSYEVLPRAISNEITITSADYADFTVKIANEYTVSELLSKLSLPDGAQALIVRNGSELLNDSTVLKGSNIVITSKNGRQNIVCKIIGGAEELSSPLYSVNYDDFTVSQIEYNTSIADFKENITLENGFALTGIYDAEEKMQSGYIASGMKLKIKSGSSFTEYTLLVNENTEIKEISSDIYKVDTLNKKIKGVLKHTPLDVFTQNLVCTQEFGIDGVYIDGEKVNGKITDSAVLKITDGKDVIEYLVKIECSTNLSEKDGGYFETSLTGEEYGKIILISGKVSMNDGENGKEISLYSPLETEKGSVMRFENDGDIYFWEHLLGKWESGKAYSFTVITDTQNAAAKVYINGEKVLDNLYTAYFSGIKNPSILSHNFRAEDFLLANVYSFDIFDAEISIPDNRVENTGRNAVRLYKNSVSAENEIINNFSIPALSEGDSLIISAPVSNKSGEPINVSIYLALYGDEGEITYYKTSDENIPANTDEFLINASVPYENIKNTKIAGIYLWNNQLMPLKEEEILAHSDYGRINEDMSADTSLNIISSALQSPNYKGLIFDKNGESDIRLLLHINSGYLENTVLKTEIKDSLGKTILSAENSTPAEKMQISFSSKYLSLGDYTLRASLLDKATNNEIDFNIHPIRKRNGKLTDLETYIDKNGRYIKDGKPHFYIGMFGDYYTNLEQIDKFKNSGLDGVFLYWQGTGGTYSEQWLDKIEESGMDFFANMRLFKENEADRVNFNLKNKADEKRLIESWADTLNKKNVVEGYFVGDEESPSLRDKLRWHSDILSSKDLSKPTVFVDWRSNSENVFLHNASADILSIDHYPVTKDKDDENIGVIGNITKRTAESFINKPVWMTLQSHSISVYEEEQKEAVCPSEKQQANMFMQAVCNGATGVWWYSYDMMLRSDNPDELLKRPLNVTKLFSAWGDIIMSDEEPPQITHNAGAWLDPIVKRYNGKTYIFAANTDICERAVKFCVNGASSVKNLYTGESYKLTDNGEFNVLMENIGIAVFEIEQGDYLSNDSKLGSISFFNEKESYYITNDAEGNMIVHLPENTTEISYFAQIPEKSQLYINGVRKETKGKITGEDIMLKIVAEDNSYTIYNLKIERG